MEIHESGGQVVRSWASILDPNTLQQALMTARCDAIAQIHRLSVDRGLWGLAAASAVGKRTGYNPSGRRFRILWAHLSLMSLGHGVFGQRKTWPPLEALLSYLD